MVPRILKHRGAILLLTLAERLRRLRKQRKLNQIDVAVAVGIDRSYLSKLETAYDNPGRDVLMALAAYYEVSLDWLATGQGDAKGPGALAQTPDEALLLYAWRALPESESKPLLQMLLSRVKPPAN
jgi:transcriptional regulator with XRE-family HTH domain